MRKIAAFFTALLLFCGVAVAVHCVTGGASDVNDRAFGTWINSKKDLSYTALKDNLEKDTVLMLGSSEFQHGRRSKYHPAAVFRETGTNVMCIGAARNQCLSHAITVGALAPSLQSRKAVLILSPTWFAAEGVDPSGFSARFSESQFAAMLENETLSASLRQRIADRTTSLLSVSPGMQADAQRDVRVAAKERPAGLRDRVLYGMHRWLDREKEQINVGLLWRLAGGKRNAAYTGIDRPAPDWDALAAEADRTFFRNSDNPFHMWDRAYNGKIKALARGRKNAYTEKRWDVSPEYDDLRLFLEVCREEQIEVLLILLPVNGYYYDYTGFPADRRQVLEENIRDIADAYGVELCDFFGAAYDRGFLEDVVHPAGKGWVKINEKVYEFCHKDAEKDQPGVCGVHPAVLRHDAGALSVYAVRRGDGGAGLHLRGVLNAGVLQAP